MSIGVFTLMQNSDSKISKTLGIVLKTTERCNINCSYCYMFNMGDESYKNRPPIISLETINALSQFLKQGCEELGIEHLIIGFHGGEPLLQKKKNFEVMCEILTSTLSPIAKLTFTMQTNAMLFDEEWINLVTKFKINVGISIDGPQEYHDKERVDHRGRGSYERVIKKIKLLQQSPLMQKGGGFGLLCVIDPAHSARKIYRHFVDDLNAKYMDFLLPYNNHNHKIPYPVQAYGDYLCELFDEWTADDNPQVKVRCLVSILDIFLGGTSHVYGVGPGIEDELPLITVTTAGELSPSDEFRATDYSVNYSGSTVFNTSLSTYLNMPIFKQIKQASQLLPTVCNDCCWHKVCGGGAIVNRYHKDNGFDNPSIYCESLKDFYSHVVTYLLNKNSSIESLLSRLNLNNSYETVA